MGSNGRRAVASWRAGNSRYRDSGSTWIQTARYSGTVGTGTVRVRGSRRQGTVEQSVQGQWEYVDPDGKVQHGTSLFVGGGGWGEGEGLR